jgi:hypothetical protein
MANKLRACAWAIAALLTAPTFLCARPAAAQAGAYALFTGAHLDTTQTTASSTTTTTVATGIYGPTFGIYANLPIPIVKIGADLRGYLLNGGGEQHYNGVIGPRIEVHIPVINIKPYFEFLVGFGSYKTTTSNSTTHGDYEYVVGVDRKLLPLIDWRILEFSDTNYDWAALGCTSNSSLVCSNTSVPTRALSTGLVVRIP